MVRAFSAGNVVATKQEILTTGSNFVGIQMQGAADPYGEQSKPGRRPGVWQKNP